VPIRVVRGRVAYGRDLVAKLGGIANGRFNAGMCDESDDDSLWMPCLSSCSPDRCWRSRWNTMLLATMSPGLGSNSLRSRHPRGVFKNLVLPRAFWIGAYTSRSRSRPGDIDDAARRKTRSPRSAPNLELAAYEERSHSLLQQPECDPYLASLEMKSFTDRYKKCSDLLFNMSLLPCSLRAMRSPKSTSGS